MSWEEILAQKGELERQLKERSMIFDCSRKEEIAVKLGFHFSHFHEHFFDEWIAIRKTYESGNHNEARILAEHKTMTLSDKDVPVKWDSLIEEWVMTELAHEMLGDI